MARIARVVIPGVPNHVTQRGNRREPIFFEDGDYALYRDLVAAAARRAGAEVWAYCLMPNHVHLIITPSDEDGLRATLADAHRRYTSAINARHQWTGHLFQGRFGAVAMDEDHLMAAARYLALNPVRAGLVRRATDWRWSSARAHVKGTADPLLTPGPLANRMDDPGLFFSTGRETDAAMEARVHALERAASIGRPVGSAEFLQRLEAQTGRTLAPARRGPKPRAAA